MRTTLYQTRRAKLSSEGFLAFETRSLGHFKLKSPYMQKMRAERKALVRSMVKAAPKGRLSQAKFEAEIKSLYAGKGWIVTQKGTATGWNVGKRRHTFSRAVGAADPIAMLKEYYKRTVKLEDYVPPKRKRKGSIDKGKVREQKARYEARYSNLGNTRDTTILKHGDNWISQLRDSMTKQPERRAEFQSRIDNLETRMKEARQ